MIIDDYNLFKTLSTFQVFEVLAKRLSIIFAVAGGLSITTTFPEKPTVESISTLGFGPTVRSIAQPYASWRLGENQ